MNTRTQQRTWDKNEKVSQINLRLSESLIQKLREYAIKNSKSQSLVIEESLNQFFKNKK